MNKQNKLHILGNVSGLIIVSLILLFVFIDQFVFHDLPCPLCLLQRLCFIGIGLCFVMNLRMGIRPAHYGLMFLVTLIGLAISLRQGYLHLAPGDPGYGMQLFGQYLYTWAALSFFIILILISVALLLDKGFNAKYTLRHKAFSFLLGFFLVLILANGISTFIECGPHECPDNPTEYYLLK